MKKITTWLFLLFVPALVVGIFSCNKTSKKDITELAQDIPAGIIAGNEGNSDRQIKLKLIKESCYYKLPFYKKQADSAIKIAEAVFNSTDFKLKIENLDFKYSSYCKGKKSCTENEDERVERISGNTVLNDLFREPSVNLKISIYKKGNALGKTCPNNFHITMFYNNIMHDMEEDDIPPSYKLAVNICHEYMHQIGYCHIYDDLKESDGRPDPRYINDDVTYRIGWEAFYILVEWYKTKKHIDGLEDI